MLARFVMVLGESLALTVPCLLTACMMDYLVLELYYLVLRVLSTYPSYPCAILLLWIFVTLIPRHIHGVSSPHCLRGSFINLYPHNMLKI